jgi:fatty acid synthase subunit alpha
MDDNNILAEGLERFNLKTFSQDEMALRIIGLMALPIVQANYLEPLLADLSGGLNLVPDIKEKMVTIRNELSEMSSSHRILAKEQEAESNASLAGMESAALPSFNKRANIKLDFPRLLDYESEIKQFSNLEGMIDLEKVCTHNLVLGSHPQARDKSRYLEKANKRRDVESAYRIFLLMIILLTV